MMTKLAYVRTAQLLSNDDAYHVYPAIVIRENVDAKKSANLLVIDRTGGMRFVTTEHYNNRCSAGYWVFQEEFDLIYQAEKRDWESCGFWREAWEDCNNIRHRLAKLVDNLQEVSV